VFGRERGLGRSGGQGSAELTYYVDNAPASLSQAEVVAAIEQALGAWADVADINFTETVMRAFDNREVLAEGRGVRLMR